MSDDLSFRRWMSLALAISGLIGLGGGLGMGAFPDVAISTGGLADRQMMIWLGGAAVASGLCCLAAAPDPYRRWSFLLAAFAGHVMMAVWLAIRLSTASGSVPLAWCLAVYTGLISLTLATLLWGALRTHHADELAYAGDLLDDDPLRDLKSTCGRNLRELSELQPQLVVFLRHTGCTFCRESLAKLQDQREAIERLGAGIVLVHLGEDQRFAAMLMTYGLDDVPRIADPTCRLYGQFGLELGGFRQLFGLRVLIRGIKAAFVDGHGLGGIEGNVFQLPGAFVMHGPRIVAGFQHRTAADRVDYLQLVRSASAVPVMMA